METEISWIFVLPKKGGIGIQVHQKPVKKFKEKLKKITGRSNSMSMIHRI